MKVRPLLNKVTGDFIREYLVACGVKEDEVEHYINAPLNSTFLDSPALYVNIDKMVQELHYFVQKQALIGIICDEDFDGVASTTIMASFLQSLGLKPIIFFHEVPKTHGIRAGSAENLLPKIIDSGIELLIIPDASIDTESCNELGLHHIKVHIIDHHQLKNCGSNGTIVNCTQQDCTNQSASGTLVTNKVVQRYCETYDLPCPNNDDLVSCSLISDVMNMVDNLENRVIVHNWIEGEHNESRNR